MARKAPFRNIRVGTHILEVLDKLRGEENRKEFRPLSLNAFCEKVLWDYANGRLAARGQEFEEMVADRPARGETTPLLKLPQKVAETLPPRFVADAETKKPRRKKAQ